MATRSTIGYKEINNGVEEFHSIYCHWDGYIEHNGRILLEHYNDLEKIKHLLSFGQISSLDETIESSIFYHRDRNEDLSLPVIDYKLERTYRQDYNYMFIDGQWFVNGSHLSSNL